jgi:hypothetical protein
MSVHGNEGAALITQRLGTALKKNALPREHLHGITSRIGMSGRQTMATGAPNMEAKPTTSNGKAYIEGSNVRRHRVAKRDLFDHSNKGPRGVRSILGAHSA